MSEKETTKNKAVKEKILEHFIERRQIYLWGAVMDKSCEDILEKMIFMENSDPGKPIYFFINSPGGVISSGMAIYDMMQMISSPVYTVNMGMAASMGALLFSAGAKGHRYMFPHARVMIHQPLISGQIVAPAIDIKIHADEIKKTKNELNRILAENCGQSVEKIEIDTDRDYWMNANEAIKYGIADQTITDLNSFIAAEKPKKAAAKSKTKSVK